MCSSLKKILLISDILCLNLTLKHANSILNVINFNNGGSNGDVHIHGIFIDDTIYRYLIHIFQRFSGTDV